MSKKLGKKYIIKIFVFKVGVQTRKVKVISAKSKSKDLKCVTFFHKSIDCMVDNDTFLKVKEYAKGKV